MKKAMSVLLAMMLILTGLTFAEGVEEAEYVPADYDYNQLVVGSTTALSGRFFTDMWGNSTSDLDVRALLHGYGLVEWQNELGGFWFAGSTVNGYMETENEAGDHTYILGLYRDLYYSDGTPITAKDYAFSILLSMAPEIAEIGGQTGASDYLVGADEYKTGAAKTLAGVRLLNDYEISISIKGEYLPFYYELGLLDYKPYPISVIAPGCEIADDGNGVYIRNADPEQTEPLFTADVLRETILNEETGYMTHPTVTSGPYRLVSFDGTTAEFEINPRYRDEEDAPVASIPRLIYTLADNADMIEKLEAGEFGLLNKCVNAETVTKGIQLASTGYYAMKNYARTGLSLINFCCERPGVNEQTVRQAIALCLDRDALVGNTVNYYGLKANGYYGLGQWMFLMVNGTLKPSFEEPAEDASESEKQAYEADMQALADLNLDNVATYELDPEAAALLLDNTGWTLNENGEPFDPAADSVRCKTVDGELVKLQLKLCYPEGNAVGEFFQTALADNLAGIGIQLTLEAKPMQELLRLYYREDPRDCDMIYLATNFDVIFDPSFTFSGEYADVGLINQTAIKDDVLYEKAVDLRKTEPNDIVSYCTKWVAFQERFAEVLPAIPVYSNVYYDFHTGHLQNYSVVETEGWAESIIPAVMADFPVEETEEEPVEEGEEGGEELVTFD